MLSRQKIDMNIDNIKKGIEKTGFRLEFDISNVLSKNGWNVINNKYYVDDQQETVREIDIVAYKATYVHKMYVYTVLILSCKKSEENAWVLLSKDPDHNDPNMEWIPVHAWSNERKLEYMFEEQEWKETYLSTLNQNQSTIVSAKPEKHIFGFQEMKKESGAPQNDKHIFNSITSVMKAQAYEMNALPLRKKDPCVFQFNLLSIAQTELIRLDFGDNSIEGVPVDDEVYLAGYIVDKQQTFAKVHFIRSEKFESILKRYNNLHEANKKAFRAVYDRFCKEITVDYKKQNLFREDVASDLWWPVHQKFENLTGLSKLFKEGCIDWDKDDEVLEFQIDLDAEDVAKINSDNSLRKALSKSLKKYYEYEGVSRFGVNDIPF